MTDFHNIESTVADLEGASNALNNVVQSEDIPIECADGLKWLALQINIERGRHLSDPTRVHEKRA